MMLPTHVVLVLHAFSSVTWDDQTYVGCEHDALTLSWNGHHNVIELQNYDDCASNITGQLVPYHDAGYVEPIPPSMLASPGATRYYKCGLHCDAGAKFAITCPADACPHLSTDACRAWRQFVDTFLIRENLDGNAYLDPCNSVHITCRNGVVTELHSTASPLPASHEPVFTFEQRDWVQDYFPNASYMEIVFMVLSSSQPTVRYPTPLANVTDLRINCPVGAMPSSYTTLTRLTVYGNCVYDHDARGALASNLSQLEYLSTYRFTAYPKSYKLNGTLPSDAPRLQHLSVPYNDLTGTIPANMAQLTHLDVRENKLTGTVNVPSTVHTCNLTDPYTFKDLWIRYFYNNPTYTLRNYNTFTCPLPAHCTGVCFGTPNTSCGGLSANATKDQCDAMITLLLKYASRESFENLTIYNATTQTYDFCGRTERHCTQAGRGDLGFFDAGSLKLQCRHAEHNCTFTDELVNALSNIYIHSAIIIDGYTGALPQQLPLLNSAQQFRITNSTFRCPYPEWVKLDPTFASAPCVPALADTAPAPCAGLTNPPMDSCDILAHFYNVTHNDLKFDPYYAQSLNISCSYLPPAQYAVNILNCKTHCDCNAYGYIVGTDATIVLNKTCADAQLHFNVSASQIGNYTHFCSDAPDMIFTTGIGAGVAVCGCNKNCEFPLKCHTTPPSLSSVVNNAAALPPALTPAPTPAPTPPLPRARAPHEKASLWFLLLLLAPALAIAYR